MLLRKKYRATESVRARRRHRWVWRARARERASKKQKVGGGVFLGKGRDGEQGACWREYRRELRTSS